MPSPTDYRLSKLAEPTHIYSVEQVLLTVLNFSKAAYVTESIAEIPDNDPNLIFVALQLFCLNGIAKGNHRRRRTHH